MSENRGAIVGGAILIALGIAFALMQFFDFSGSIVLLAIGFAFLVAFGVTRVYGLLIPGCIVFGLGLGVLAEDLLPDLIVEPVLIGLGLGFVAIWVVDRLVSRQLPARAAWWPLVPGGVLLLVGVASGIENFEIVWQYLWPIALVGLGVFVLVRGIWGGRHGPGPGQPHGPAQP